MGAEYTLFLLEDREGKPVAVLLPTEAVAAQEQVLPQVRAPYALIVRNRRTWPVRASNIGLARTLRSVERSWPGQVQGIR